MNMYGSIFNYLSGVSQIINGLYTSSTFLILTDF